MCMCMYVSTYLHISLLIYLCRNKSKDVMIAFAYINIFQVQGVKILMVSLPQYQRPPFPCDGTGQHSALANCDCGDSHFLVIWKMEQVHVCWQTTENTYTRVRLSYRSTPVKICVIKLNKSDYNTSKSAYTSYEIWKVLLLVTAHNYKE